MKVLISINSNDNYNYSFAPFRQDKNKEAETTILYYNVCNLPAASTFAIFEYSHMNETHEKLNELFNRIPRRHTPDNVKEMYNILNEYEECLQTMEADARYEPQVAPFFETLDLIRAMIKKSNDNKASKKVKDTLFDEASGALKDTMQELMQL